MQQLFIIISSILVFLSYAIYGWSIIKGLTKPHRTTRFVLLTITILGAASLYAQQDRVSFWLIAICAASSLIIFLLSFKYGMGGWGKVDIMALVIALIGIVVWRLTDNPVLGLYASVLADFSGMIPALIKTWRLPHTEYYLSYVFDIFAGTFTLLAIQNWQLGIYLYPLYIVLINLIMLGLILRPKLALAK